MVCRVCKHELNGNICDFCGEDNTEYINADTAKTCLLYTSPSPRDRG